MKLWRPMAAMLVVISAVTVVVVAAVVADGRASSTSYMNDGGAWLLNRSQSSLGHVNRVVGEVDQAVGPFSGSFDVEQSDGVVVVNNRGVGQVVLVDTNLAQPGAPLTVSPSVEVFAAPGTVILADPETGGVWRFDRELFGTIGELKSSPPLVQASPGMAIAVGREGTIVIADATASTITVVRPSSEPEAIAVSDWGEARVSGVTLVGSVPVVGLDDGRVMIVRSSKVDTHSLDTAVAVWQRPSEAGTSVVGIGPGGEVIEINLRSGVETATDAIEGDSPQAPIVHDGCVWTVTAAPAPTLHHCGRADPLPGAGREIKLTLVNGWVWVNDVNQGGVWFVREDQAEEVNDWSAALNLKEADDQIDEAGGGDEELVENASAEELSEDVDQFDDDEKNEPPVAEDDLANARQGRPIVVNVLANDTDGNNDPLAVESLTGVDANGMTSSGAFVAISPSGTGLQVAPPEDLVGEIKFGYVIHDGRKGRDSATVRVTVHAPTPESNRAPVTVDDNATVRAGRTVAMNVLTNDSDPDGDVLVVMSVSSEQGSVNFTPDGEVSYTPDVTNNEGTISLEYVVADDYGAEAGGTIRVRVRRSDSNQRPEARNDVGRTSVGRPVIVDVLANDMDPDGDPLVVSNLQSVDGAVSSAQLTPDGRFLYRPESEGTFRFTYTVSDGPEVDQALIRIDAERPTDNRPPVTALDEVALAAGESRLVRVLENDGDPDGDVVGVVEWVATDGLEISEVPGVGFVVLATPVAEPRSVFRYWISDGIAPPVRGDVVVSVVQRDPVDYPPVAVADIFEVRAGQTSSLAVLRNDRDPEGKFLRVVPPGTALEEGLLRVSADRQTLLLTVDADQRFSFDFNYDIEDPAGNRSSATIAVRVVDPNQPNRAPVAGPDIARTSAATPIVVQAMQNDFDPDGDPINIESIASQPEHGTVEILEDGSIVYTPRRGFGGTDSFVYTLVDGYQAPPGSAVEDELRGPARDLGEVYVGVMPVQSVNRAPTAVDDLDFPPVGFGGTAVRLNVLANDSDPDADSIAVTEVIGLRAGEAKIGSQGRWITYTPPADGEPGPISFRYSIADGRGGVASAQVVLALTDEPEPIPPQAVDDTVGPIRAGEVITFDPRVNDLDPDGERAGLSVVAESGLLAVLADGRVRLEAPEQTSDVAYRVRDAQGLESETAFITVLVTENQAPVVAPASVETPFNTPVTINLHDYVSDPDDDPLAITLGQRRSGGSAVVTGQSRDNFLQVEFTPDTDFEGAASFDFNVDDRSGHNVAGRVTVNVLPPENRPPVAAPASVVGEAGTPVLIRLPQYVEDPDPDAADTHSYSVGGPSSNKMTVTDPNGAGEVWVNTSVDAGSFSGSFEYTVSDGEFSDSNTVTVEIEIPDFAPPSLTDDSAKVLQGESTPEIDLLANDVDNSPPALKGAGLEVTAVGVTPDGTVDTVGNSVVFTPHPDFFGTTTFTYTVQDGRRSAEGQSTGLVSVEVVGRPDKPQPPTIEEVGNSYVIVQWRAPQGSSARGAVTGYILEYSAGDGSSGSQTFTEPTTSHRWTGLTNGVDYCFRVTAVNEAGAGEPSDDGECRKPDIRPEPPAAPSVDFGDSQLKVTWAPPLNQGSEIINYQVRISGPISELSGELGRTTEHTWTGLVNGVDYRFEVRAQNGASEDNDGWSDWSGLSSPEHPLTVPDPPAAPRAVRGDRQVQITWGAPYDGGDSISLFQVRSSISGDWRDVTPQGDQTTYTWEGIPNGTDVSFEVRAINRDPRSVNPGNVSPPSEVVRTCSIPDAPGKPTVVRGDRQVTVSWTPPANQGCAITEYRIRSSGGAERTAPGGSSTFVFTGLENGSPYTFTVTAVNEVVTVDGRSPLASASSDSVSPAGPPLATNVTEARNVGVRRVRVSWSNLGNNGSPITRFEIQVNGGGWTNVGNVTSVERTEASNGATYSYRVRAVNDVGASASTGGQQTIVTWNVPGTPAVSAGQAGDRAISGSWSAPGNGGTAFTAVEAELTTGGCPGSGVSVGVGTTSRTWSGLGYSTTYRVCVRYANAVGWGPWGQATAGTNSPPQREIDTQRGGTRSNCGFTPCNYVQASGRNFTPGAQLSYNCAGDPRWFSTTTGGSSIFADSNGNFGWVQLWCYHSPGAGGNQTITVRDGSGQASELSAW